MGGHAVQLPGDFVLGAYSGMILAAVSVSFWVNGTLIYATLFAESEAQGKGVCELMLHELRMAAAQNTGISQILIRTYQGGNSRDQYYLLRGCKLVSKPAHLHINPVAEFLLRRFAPGAYAKLRGDLRSEEIPVAAPSIEPTLPPQELREAAKASATIEGNAHERLNR